VSQPTIQVEVRTVYGVDKVYPVCAAAECFAAIAGTTTLTVAVLQKILDLGYRISYRLPAPKLSDMIRQVGMIETLGEDSFERVFTGRGSYEWCPRCNSKVDDQCVCEAGL
jgi:hypothetical protein